MCHNHFIGIRHEEELVDVMDALDAVDRSPFLLVQLRYAVRNSQCSVIIIIIILIIIIVVVVVSSSLLLSKQSSIEQQKPRWNSSRCVHTVMSGLRLGR